MGNVDSVILQKVRKRLYEFFKRKYPNERKFYDLIPLLLEKRYLKTIYNYHKCVQTLTKRNIDGDGEIPVLDIDFILRWAWPNSG